MIAAHDVTLYNEDLAPVPLENRTWGTYNYASLWVAMSVCIPTYMLASGLIAGGMNWWQAIGTILLGNLIVLVPMILNAHAGTKYGIPFPVFARASFGVKGANIPAVLRALVACGWFGIQCWIGGQAIYSMLVVLWPAAVHFAAGIWICFFAFWLLNMFVVWRGIETIKVLQGISAPFMFGIGLLMLWWITSKAGGFGPVLSSPGKFKTTAEFLPILRAIADGHGGILGNSCIEHSRLYTLRQVAARSSCRSSSWTSRGYDRLLVHWRRSHVGVSSPIRRSYLGSRCFTWTISSAGHRLHCSCRAAHRDPQHQRGGERRLAFE